MQKTKIGIIGAGQLGRMMALAGIPMGCQFVFLDQHTSAPASGLGHLELGPFDSKDALSRVAAMADVVTFDVENVDAELLSGAAGDTPLWPSAQALSTAQDRLHEKTLFTNLGIPTPKFITVDSQSELHEALEQLGYPAVLKTRRLGYDGRGQRFIRSAQEADAAWQALGEHALILEEFVEFTRELSLITVRNEQGDTTCYPLTENRHSNGILHESRAPFADAELTRTATEYAKKLTEHFNYVGVLTIELFVTDTQLLANEIAPRVHNSGHWTIEGAVTSQFENHVRALLGAPLGDASARGPSAMVNFLGAMPTRSEILKIPGLSFHSYEKSLRPSRKVGHATIVAPDSDTLEERIAEVYRYYQPNLVA